MDEIESTEIKEIELEILALNKKLRHDILKIGRLQLGEKATIRQICNHVGPQFGFTSKDCLNIMFHVKEGIK